MDEVKQRVIYELNELLKRTSNLIDFTLSEKYSSLSIHTQYLLDKQIYIMLNYVDVLRRRLEGWEVEEKK